MISPKSYEEMTTYLEKPEKVVFLSTASWCPDCQFICPAMPEIRAKNPELAFIRVDHGDFMEVAQHWNIFGIPSFVVIENGEEIDHLVNKSRKTKAEINSFLAGLK